MCIYMPWVGVCHIIASDLACCVGLWRPVDALLARSSVNDVSITSFSNRTCLAYVFTMYMGNEPPGVYQ